jgi:hypothetical protein
VCVGLGGGGVGGRIFCVFGGRGGYGSVGGMCLASLITKSPRNCYNRSSTTAVSLSRSILTSLCVSLRHITIISSPLSSIFVSVYAVLLYTNVLFFLPNWERCTCAVKGDRWVFNALSKKRLSNVSGASKISLRSSGIEIRLNLVMSIVLLRYPIARFTVVYQLSWACFQPSSPPGSSTLLIYIHNFLSVSVYVIFSFGIF